MTVKILARHLLNPKPDFRRGIRNFAAVALWPAGTVFEDLGDRIFVVASPRDRFHCVAVEGPQADLLRRHLRDVTAEDAMRAILREGPQWALELLLEARLGAARLGPLFADALSQEE